MPWLLLTPLVLQGVFTFIDEFFFHQRRGLPSWEIWGHPLDSLSVLAVFAIAAFLPLNDTTLLIFSVAAVFSCLFVTKDEFVHAKLCTAGEHWLHAILFILHPLSFLAAWALWKEGQWPNILRGQFLIVLVFMLYQIIYWGLQWRRQRRV